MPKLRTQVVLMLAPIATLAVHGCGTKSYSAWRPLSDGDVRTLREYYGLETRGRDLLRRDVTVMMLFLFPASGYLQWGERFPDGRVVPFEKDELKKRPGVPDDAHGLRSHQQQSPS